MKNFLVLMIILSFFSCSKDDDPIIEVATPQMMSQAISYDLNNGASFTTAEPTMTYAGATFLKYTDASTRIRINFQGNTTGVYTGEDAVFYIWTYDEQGNQTIDIVCDTFTGIEITVDTYGEIGELIEGSFKADTCGGHTDATAATGTFSVIRTE